MSGGHWDYSNYQIESVTDEVARTTQVKERWPLLGIKIEKLGKKLSEIIHKMDYCLSGDTNIEDDKAFEKEKINELREILKTFK